LRLQVPKHDIRIDQAELLVAESLGQRAHDSETELLVQLNSRDIRADDVVELHCHESGGTGSSEAVVNQCRPIPLPWAAGLTT
jgi:hypothetical protein